MKYGDAQRNQDRLPSVGEFGGQWVQFVERDLCEATRLIKCDQTGHVEHITYQA